MAVILVIYDRYLGKKSEKARSEKLFTLMCTSVHFTLFIDIIAWALNGISSLGVMNYILKCAVYICVYLISGVYLEYVFSYLDEQSPVIKGIRKNIYVIFAGFFVFRCIFLFTGQYFYIGTDTGLCTGPLFLLSFLGMAVISSFVCGTAAGAGLPSKRMLALLSYPISILSMACLALFNSEYANCLVVISLSLLFIYCATFLETEDSRDSLDKNMRLYLSDELVKRLSDTDEAILPGGNTEYVSMLFCSLHRFSEDTETMASEDAVEVLNHFFMAMTDIIVENRGTLIEFPGYGFFCIFGAFERNANHANSAVHAAYQMQQRMKDINKWNTENGYPELRIGIGINTGDVVLGNIGSNRHLRYTAISRHVNLASRIETYSGDGEIIVTQNTLDECDNILKAEKIRTVIPKGIAAPVDVFRVDSVIYGE